MNIFEKVNDVLRRQSKQIFTASEIKELCFSDFGLNKSSVIPSDYCYNRTNHGVGIENNILIYLGFGEYRYVGKDYQYEGWVFRREKGTKEDKTAGLWKNGIYIPLIEEEIFEGEEDFRTVSRLKREHLEALYEEYLRALKTEMDVLGCRATELRHLIGRIGELKCALETEGCLAAATNQEGFDVISKEGKRISVKTTAQHAGFVSISSTTVALVDELMVIHFHSNEFLVVYHGPIQPAIEVARLYQKKYELSLSKAKKLSSER